MNNIKNTVILFLSVVIIIQSAFLLYFLRQKPGAQKKISRQVAPRHKQEPKRPVPAVFPVEKKVVQKPTAKPAPSIVLGKIVLVLDDWGYNLKNRDFITNNDYRVTLSILPFKSYSTQVADLAYQNNKDIIIHMPLEPKNKENYGLENKTILTTMDKKTVIDLLDQAFGSVPYAKGISNHMGSKATEDARLMKIVLGYLKEKKLFFLDSLVTNKSVGQSLSKSLRLGFATRDVFIDNESDEKYIREQMVRLAQRAKQKGVAVGIGHDRPTTIAVLNKIIPELEAHGYKFVNLSEVIKD
jgi:hypothetical protein